MAKSILLSTVILLWGNIAFNIAYAQESKTARDLFGETLQQERDAQLQENLQESIENENKPREPEGDLPPAFDLESFDPETFPPPTIETQLDNQIKQEKLEQTELDPVSSNFLIDALTALRFVAISLDNEEDIGLATSGIARSFLIKDDIESALREANSIDNPLWRSRTLLSIADYYIQQDNRENAIDTLKQITDIFNDDVLLDGEVMLRLTSNRLSKLGALQESLVALSKIKNVRQQLNTVIQSISDISDKFNQSQSNIESDNRALNATVAQVLVNAESKVNDLRTFLSDEEFINIYIKIAQTYLKINDNASALKMFENAEGFIKRLDINESQKLLPILASATVPLGDIKNAMRIIQDIDATIPRAQGLSSVAVANFKNNAIDAALPLFAMAKQSVKFYPDNIQRYAILTRILVDETSSRRYADAFTTAGLIDNIFYQAQALFFMAQKVISQRKYVEALRLIDYIPYISLRARISADLVLAVVNNEDNVDNSMVDKVLANALNDTGMPIESSTIISTIERLLAVQVAYGARENDDKIFNRALEIIENTQIDINKVFAIVTVARAYALRNELDASRKLIDRAFRLVWLNRNNWINSANQNYGSALESITKGQLQLGSIFSAFDTAASIPEPTPEERIIQNQAGRYIHPRYSAMQAIAIYATNTGAMDLAIRAANEIEYAPARAQALSYIAIANTYIDNPNFPTEIFGFDFLERQWVDQFNNILQDSQIDFFATSNVGLLQALQDNNQILDF